MRIRTVRTASGSVAIQVVRYQGKRVKLLKHIGSAKNSGEIPLLKQLAREWINQFSGQESLFREGKENKDTILGKYKYLGFRYGFIYTAINQIFNILKLNNLDGPKSKMFLDFALIRTVEPVSKRESQKLLSSFFGINYDITDVYRSLARFSKFKDQIEERLIEFAKKELGFDFNFVLYDITTLYFETFASDDFRKNGFSKDNKIGQPQILIGLIVNRDGFPLAFAVFEGNKFEGHTLIPTILGFKKKHQVRTLTVVADAAMISRKNIKALKQAKLSYIVGARLGNMKLSLISQIGKGLNAVDGATIRLPTSEGFLICSFSGKRYSKDKHEMEKQLEKAQLVLDGKREAKKNKFLAKNAKIKYSLNEGLIEKTKLLLGVRGYHTDLNIPDNIAIERYSDLWNVERAFRISKNDLSMRPIYHFKKETIEAHILICVVALAVLKFMEIKTKRSAKNVVDNFKSVTDGRILNTITGKESYLRSEISEEIQLLLEKMGLPH